jgi:predicted RNA binding protein YcfA (HicA-like mRNA interferase family)
MPKLRRLSGDDVVRALSTFGFRIHSQKGSHMKLRRATEEGEEQTLTVPCHRELNIGMCRAIFQQASRYVSPRDLARFFYSE